MYYVGLGDIIFKFDKLWV